MSLSMREQLRNQTGDARRQQARVSAEIDRMDRPPEPGDLYVLAETSEHPVEWVILDRDRADPRRLLTIPADMGSWVGSADVAIEAPRPLTLRCAYGVWIDAGAFRSENRTGFLEPESLERARGRLAAVERSEVTGSVLEREVDDEAEYREWRQTLEAAREAVPSRAPEKQEGWPGKVIPWRRRGWGSSSNLLALAASVLLLLTLGLGSQLMESMREQRLSVAEQRAEVERLEQEQQRLTEEHRRDLARLRDEYQESQLEQQQRVAELEAAARPRARINLPLIILASSQLRGGPESIAVAPDADSLMLILPIESPEAFSRYRLEIRHQASGRQVWRDSGLVPSRLSELTALLPRSLMPDGRYELRLFGLRGSQPERLMEQILILETARQSGG